MSSLPKIENVHIYENYPIQIGLQFREMQIGFFVFAHLILGVIFFQFPSLSTLHVYATIGTGTIWALSKPRIYAAYVAAYIVGTEALWRMTDAYFFWEGGKYSVVLILALSLFHHRQKWIPVLPLFYLLLLLPSILLTLDAIDLSMARDAVSFNLSGPLTLFVSAWFFSTIRLHHVELVQILSILVAPITTMTIYTGLDTIMNVDRIKWVNDSMIQTSGGFGPNQVSTIIGLGISAIWILIIFGKRSFIFKLCFVLIGILFLIQGLLTFSRGGILGALIVISFISIHTVKNGQQRSRLFSLLLIIIPVVFYLILPMLNKFTEGFVEVRFTDTNLTHRDILIQEELQLFRHNILAGVGPGIGNTARGYSSHTEMTRLLAEHGLLGMGSLLMLFFMVQQQYFNSKGMAARGLRGGLMLWSLFFMTNAAMRLAAVSFTFGLVFAQIQLDE